VFQLLLDESVLDNSWRESGMWCGATSKTCMVCSFLIKEINHVLHCKRNTCAACMMSMKIRCSGIAPRSRLFTQVGAVLHAKPRPAAGSVLSVS